MRFLLIDLGTWIAAVFSYWQSYVTGGGITALTALYEKVTGQTLPRWIYLANFLVVFLLMSFFLAWRDEHTIAVKFDDRRLQQEKADEYAKFVDHGRSDLVNWVDAIGKQDAALIQTYRNRALTEWLPQVRDKLTEDFGPSVAQRFNLGRSEYQQLIIGASEPREHEARLVTLDRLVQEMRSGQLPLKAKREKQ